MKVDKLPVDPGPAGWNTILPERASRPPLEERATADWLVIGAGFAGLAAARRLAQLDPAGRIVVLEARGIAEGPPGRNSGFMIDLPHDLSSKDYGGTLARDANQIVANRLAIEFAADAAREYGMSAEAFARSGKVNAAATEKGLADNGSYAGHLTALGETHEILDAADMRALTGSSYYRGGLLTPGAAMVQPAMFVRGLADGLVSNRIALFEHSPVVDLARTGGSWVATTPRGALSAPRRSSPSTATPGASATFAAG